MLPGTRTSSKWFAVFQRFLCASRFVNGNKLAAPLQFKVALGEQASQSTLWPWLELSEILCTESSQRLHQTLELGILEVLFCCAKFALYESFSHATCDYLGTPQHRELLFVYLFSHIRLLHLSPVAKIATFY